MSRSLVSVLLLALSFSLCAKDSVKAIQSSVASNLSNATALLEQSVNINSGTFNAEGVKAVGDLMKPAFSQLGFTTQWIDGAPFNRAGHLVAKRGTQGPKILLIGHLDTVFEPDSPLQRYEPLESHFVRGPGITDMKGGNVVMLLALQALNDIGMLDHLQVQVVLTGDEENRGDPLELAVAPLLDAGKWADVALGFEDGDGDPATAVIARRSSSSWMLEVEGTPAHSSQIFREDIGFGAAFELARILNDFRKELAGEDLLTFNPGLVAAGTELTAEEGAVSAMGKNNVIAQTAQAWGDIRVISLEQLKKVHARMREITANSLPGTTAKITFIDRYPPMAPSDGNRQLLSLYRQASLDLGRGDVAPVDPRRAGAADISFVANHVQMALDGLGLMGTGGHTIDETADMRTLTSQAERAALLMVRLVEWHKSR